MNREREFAALYYPFSRCFNETTLKRALLYFDKLYFLDPYNLDQRENSILTSHYYDAVCLEDRRRFARMVESVYRPLEGEGWVEGIDIYPLIEKYDIELTQNTLSDIGDLTFCSYSFGDVDINEEYVCWHLLKERTPRLLLHRLKEVPWNDLRRQVASAAARFARFMGDGKYFSFEREYYKSLEEPEFRGRFPAVRATVEECPVVKYPILPLINAEPGEYTGYIVPYGIGASVSINQALLVSALKGYSLFTDSLTQHYLLRRKCQLAIEKRGDSDWTEKSLRLIQKIKETDIVVSLLDDCLLGAFGKEVGFEELIRFRRSRESELRQFRQYMLAMRNISSDPWTDAYVSEVMRIVDQIKVEATKLEKEFQSLHKALLRDTLKTAVNVALGLAVTPLNVTAGAVLAILASKAPLDDLWAAWKKKSELRGHDLTYLLIDDWMFDYGQRGFGGVRPWEKLPLWSK